ncbi:MAG: hypothetical protein GY751_02935, partial [Bacteroidetes bacterium]|nr:hypothetical protein [Bacteroidota bacterium]
MSGIILSFAILVHWGWKGVVLWDRFVNRQIKQPGKPFLWFTPKYHGGLSLRFEYLFFAVLRKNSYFQTNWWSLKASAILAIP